MSLHPVRKAFVATSLALAGLSASAVLAPISAQQALAEAQGAVPCANTTGNYGQKATEAMVRCEIRELDKRIEQNKRDIAAAQARGAAADRRAAAAEAESRCSEKLIAGVQSGAIRPEAGKAILGGKSVQEFGACNLLSRLTRS
jgi:hypothetical protein